MKIRKLVGNVLLLVVSTFLSIIAVEMVFRVIQFDSAFQAAEELEWLRGTKGFFMVDPDFGFRPRLKTNVYSEYGTRNNAYKMEKEEGVKRLLFIGDSVTFRGKIVDALRDQYGGKEFEYWNAGVESFNTIQEFNFLKKYNLNINPDHVILSFHLNDYETTPVVFYQGDELRVYAPNTKLENTHPWLLQNSHIYRLVLNLSFKEDEALEARSDIVGEVHEYLEKMQQLLANKDISFTVLVLPYFKPYESWTRDEQERRESILATLTKLDIRHFDLLALSEEAQQKGISVEQKKGDSWHPSEDISAIFAKHLHEQRLF